MCTKVFLNMISVIEVPKPTDTLYHQYFMQPIPYPNDLFYKLYLNFTV